MSNENKNIWSRGKCVTEKYLTEFVTSHREEIPLGTDLVVFLEKPAETRAQIIGQIRSGESPVTMSRSDFGETEWSARDNYEKSYRTMKFP